MHRVVFLLLLLAFPARAADALVLSCIPLRSDAVPKIDAYLDAFSNGNYPPMKLESIRVLARFGEDVYEFHPEQVKQVSLRDGVLRIHMMQPLSAGETAEMRFEGKIGAKKGEPFELTMFVRNERRSGQGKVRCTIE